MKKKLKLAGLLLVFQAVSFYMVQTGIVLIRDDCTTYKTVGWQCSSGGDPYYWFVIGFLALPPLFAKLLLRMLGRRVSWRELLLTHAALVILIFVVIAASEFISASSGA